MKADLSGVRQQLLDLLEAQCGIGASGGRRPGWLVSRVDRAAEALIDGVHDNDVLTFLKSHPGELERLAEIVRVGETRFFRDPEQWQALQAEFSALAGPAGRLRALSAGCSTGEEAWTLAMVLAAPSLASFRVVGVDRSAVALEQARRAEYPAECATHIPAPYARRFLSYEETCFRIRSDLKKQVNFVQKDLLSGPPPGRYEVIVCKNLLIYLGNQAATTVLTGLFRALSPGGVLLVARAELGKAKALGLPLKVITQGVSVISAPG